MCKGKAQNRIEYIVLQKPKDAAGIVEKFGYEAPKNKMDLVETMKMLVRKKGEPVVKELVAIHPERNLILEVTGHNPNPKESSYCGCHAAYTGDPAKMSSMSKEDLQELYEDTKKRSREKPDDKTLMSQVESVWDELKKRKKQEEAEAKKMSEASQHYWLHLGLAFLAGIVIAKIT